MERPLIIEMIVLTIMPKITIEKHNAKNMIVAQKVKVGKTNHNKT